MNKELYDGLLKEILKTQNKLNVATQNFEYAEGDLIDYYAYQIKAYKAKMDYLIKEVKERKITKEFVEDLKLRLLVTT